MSIIKIAPKPAPYTSSLPPINELMGQNDAPHWHHLVEVQVGVGWKELTGAKRGAGKHIMKLMCILNPAIKGAIVFQSRHTPRLIRALKAACKMDSPILDRGAAMVDTWTTDVVPGSNLGVKDKLSVSTEYRSGMTESGVVYRERCIVVSDIDKNVFQFNAKKVDELVALLTRAMLMPRNGRAADNHPWILGTIRGRDPLAHAN